MANGAMVASRPEDVVWGMAPIPPDWIVEGAPHARSADLSRSRDGLASTAMWDCTAGTFRWYNYVDETVHVLEGEVSVTDPGGQSRDLQPGDVVLFRTGSTFTWHVPRYVRKLAFLHHAVPRPAGVLVRGLTRVRGGLARRLSSLSLTLMVLGV